MIGGKKINCGNRKITKCKSAKKKCVWNEKTKKCSKNLANAKKSVKKSIKKSAKKPVK